jgi:hypothetical protein
MAKALSILISGLLLAACGQEPGNDLTGGRSFQHEERWFIATCEEVRPDLLGEPLGSIKFEDTSLRLRTIEGVPSQAALAIEWTECESSWNLAPEGQLGEAPDIDGFREVLR